MMEHENLYSNLLDAFKEPRSGNLYYDHNKNPQPRLQVMDNSKGDMKVFCTYCIHMPVPAVKWCTLCEASLCDVHLQLHSSSREHVLVNPTEIYGNVAICSIHNEALRFYCIEDAACICSSCCLVGTHKKHQVEPLTEASERKKKDFKNILEKLYMQQRETVLGVQNLQSQRKTLKEKANNLSVRVSDQFRDVRYQLDDLELRILNEIAKEENKLAEPMTLLTERLERQKDEFSRNISLIEELCNLSDPLTMLRKLEENQANFWHPKGRLSLVCNPDDLDEGLIIASLQRSLDDIMARLKRRYWASDVTMDVRTAANDVYVSGDKRTVSWSKINQRRQKTAERFKSQQVMSTQRFTSGRHYWEIDTSPSGKWIVGVSYPSMDRKGEMSIIGNNDKSWGLSYVDKKYKAIHARNEKHLPSLLPCNKIGIYLDYEAGQLSFYEVSEFTRHIHTFTTTFTEPVHAAAWVWYSWVRLST